MVQFWGAKNKYSHVYVILLCLLPSATVVAEKLCFHRCLSVHRGGGGGIHPPPPRQTPLARDGWLLQRMVRILLEFITGHNEFVAKVMFLLVSVILLTGGVCLSACWDTTTPKQTPPEQTLPWEQTPPFPREQTPLPQEADSGIRSMSGRYASYWNAFLFLLCFYLCSKNVLRRRSLRNVFDILSNSKIAFTR